AVRLREAHTLAGLRLAEGVDELPVGLLRRRVRDEGDRPALRRRAGAREEEARGHPCRCDHANSFHSYSSSSDFVHKVTGHYARKLDGVKSEGIVQIVGGGGGVSFGTWCQSTILPPRMRKTAVAWWPGPSQALVGRSPRRKVAVTVAP